MQRFKKSLALLDQIILKLEKNVGTSNQVVQKTQVENNQQQQVPDQNKKSQKKKKEKKPKKPQPPKLAPELELFSKMDLRVGEIIEAKPLEGSEKLYIEKIKFANDEVRQILSGLQQYVPLDQMKGKCIVYYNLKPRPLAGQKSEGMVLCTSNKDHTKIELLRPDDSAELGTRVHLLGKDVEIPENLGFINSKKLKKTLELLKTDENCKARFGEYLLGADKLELQTTSFENGSIS